MTDDGNGCVPTLCSISTLNDCKQICMDDENDPKKYKCFCFESYYFVGNDCILKNAMNCTANRMLFVQGTRIHVNALKGLSLWKKMEKMMAVIQKVCCIFK